MDVSIHAVLLLIPLSILSLRPNGHTYAHTQTVTHWGAINLNRADEKGSRGYGESVKVGVAERVTGLGALACFVNTAADVKRGHCLSSLKM